ncbi:MAG: hypothetical protein ACTHU0_26170 [Kofleriaceae bacterium]
MANVDWIQEPVPQARVVRNGAQRYAPPPEPKRPRRPAAEQLRVALGVAMGLWPLTAVVLLMIGLLIIAGNSGAP